MSDYYKDNKGREFPLFKDVFEAVTILLQAYGGGKKRGWIFRGQEDATWDMIPTLYRPPSDEISIKKRREHTTNFIDDLRKKSVSLGIDSITDKECLSIAQHYGLATNLLDFTYNPEVAVIFATCNQSSNTNIGVIYCIQIKKYKQLENPFFMYKMNQRESEDIMKESGMETVPSLIEDIERVPRIKAQEGVFVEFQGSDSHLDLLDICIERFYFRQKKGEKYFGNMENYQHLLPEMSDFRSSEEYEIFIDQARFSHPEIFTNTAPISELDLYPLDDPISKFASGWLNVHCEAPKNKFREFLYSENLKQSMKHEAEKAGMEGMRFSSQGSLKKAVDKYIYALNIYDRIGDLKGKANCLNKIGVMYCDSGRLDEALDFLIDGLNIEKKFGDDYSIATAMINIGGTLKELSRLDEALQYYNEAQLIAVRLDSSLGKDMILASVRNELQGIQSQ